MNYSLPKTAENVIVLLLLRLAAAFIRSPGSAGKVGRNSCQAGKRKRQLDVTAGVTAGCHCWLSLLVVIFGCHCWM